MDWAVVTQERALGGVLAIASKSHVKYFFVHPQFQRYGIGKLLWYFGEQSGLLGPSLTVRSSLFAVPVYETSWICGQRMPQRSLWEWSIKP